jgi:thiamine biosynthesis protein ThiI
MTTPLSEQLQPILIRYHEIATKGLNRDWFEDRLCANIKRMLVKIYPELEKDIRTERLRGRIILHAPFTTETESTLKRVFGISSFSPALRVQTDLEVITNTVIRELKSQFDSSSQKPQTFRVFTRRSEKAIALGSMEIDRHIGSAVLREFPLLKVDLHDPDLIVGLEVRRNTSFLYVRKIWGPGGLPTQTNGRLLALLSGGIDSPVAALQMMKRGAEVSFVHFYGTPFVGEEALDKVKALYKLINQYQPKAQPLFVVPFGLVQEKIALVTNPKLRTLLYRRMMLRIAEKIAHNMRAQAIVTGEALGQVASQTLENLTVVNAVATMPILRPLVGMDKSDIIALAKSYDTYSTSILPATDCCTLFADHHPVLKSNLGLIADQEVRFDVEGLTTEAANAGWNSVFKNFPAPFSKL